MKKFFSILYIFLVLILSSAFNFPDNLPDWKEIPSYTTEKLHLQKTTLKEFNKLASEVQPYKLANEIQIFTLKPETIGEFKEVNVGFRSQTLDWLEFIFDKQIELNEFVNIYGLPNYIEKQYSETLDYYNYDSFSLAVDKNHNYVMSVSIFSTSLDKSNLQDKVSMDSRTRFFDIFPKLRPGVTTEREFAQNYPDLLPYMEEEFDLNSLYTLTDELKGAMSLYHSAVLRFENGLLTWINLTPADQDLETMLKELNSRYNIEKISATHDFYIFDNFILTVDREQKTVNNIGIVNYDKRF